MLFALQALGVEFVDVFRPGRLSSIISMTRSEKNSGRVSSPTYSPSLKTERRPPGCRFRPFEADVDDRHAFGPKLSHDLKRTVRFAVGQGRGWLVHDHDARL